MRHVVLDHLFQVDWWHVVGLGDSVVLRLGGHVQSAFSGGRVLSALHVLYGRSRQQTQNVGSTSINLAGNGRSMSGSPDAGGPACRWRLARLADSDR